MKIASHETAPLRNLEIIHSRLITESMALEGFSDTIKRVMPSIATSMKTFFNDLPFVVAEDKGSDQPKFTRRGFEETQRLLEKQDHTKIMSLRVYTPEGFKGHLPGYVEELLVAQKFVNNIVGEILTPFNTYLSKLISDKKSIMDTRIPMQHLGQAKHDRENITARLGTFFEPGSTNTSCKLGDVIQRAGDWKQFSYNVEQLSENFDPKKPGQVKEAIGHCAEFLDILSTNAENDDLREISAQNLRVLGDITLEVAHQVELFSLVNYQVNSLLAVMGQNTEFLKKALKG